MSQKLLPIQNPDEVILICPLTAAQHCLPLNAPVKVIRKEIEGARDANGLCIWVMSNAQTGKRPEWLSSNMYKLKEK